MQGFRAAPTIPSHSTEGITTEKAKSEGIRSFVLKPADFTRMAEDLREWTTV